MLSLLEKKSIMLFIICWRFFPYNIEKLSRSMYALVVLSLKSLPCFQLPHKALHA